MIRNYIILCIVLVSSISTLKAQFTYAGIDFGYQFMRYEKGSQELFENTDNHQFKINLSFIHRPVRYFGIGLSIGIPAVNGFKSSFNGSPTSSGRDFSEDDFSSFGSNYEPRTFEYEIRNGTSKTLVARLFMSVESNSFIDFRYSFMNVEETFTFKRSGTSPRSINFQETHQAKGPGFSIGYMPLIGDGFYIKYLFSMDFYKFDLLKPSFTYNIAFDEDFSTNQPEFVELESKIGDKEIAYFFSMGFGYSF